jgi:hypothetical protein
LEIIAVGTLREAIFKGLAEGKGREKEEGV